ncbi:MAG: hypothetical protein COT45_04095 [bacterium (Candidatus Stahlbacteria) CG08_land_8_20_14_0_20_40_26]|nr:MAG: hypothetical protein COX49_01260 [bacterium (Candidatus Stahlbacteria) CG23_combo_of_CG06-09_8_20_14_all_40_9]PIS24529.1 MAG: hypothetical protein COT45_04095 [bacterium (Candidatus Stahlbacteria) CG08_land_8_20_14_0_20_40_26]
MIQLNIKCPHCGKSLMDEEHTIDDHPSVNVIIEFKKKRGWLRLSSLYGSYNTESEFPIPKEEIVRFFCPYCNSNLRVSRDCERCGAPMVAMKIVGGAIVEICSRYGCKKHLIAFENLERELSAFYDAFSYSFRGISKGSVK